MRFFLNSLVTKMTTSKFLTIIFSYIAILLQEIKKKEKRLEWVFIFADQMYLYSLSKLRQQGLVKICKKNPLKTGKVLREVKLILKSIRVTRLCPSCMNNIKMLQTFLKIQNLTTATKYSSYHRTLMDITNAANNVREVMEVNERLKRGKVFNTST